MQSLQRNMPMVTTLPLIYNQLVSLPSVNSSALPHLVAWATSIRWRATGAPPDYKSNHNHLKIKTEPCSTTITYLRPTGKPPYHPINHHHLALHSHHQDNQLHQSVKSLPQHQPPDKSLHHWRHITHMSARQQNHHQLNTKYQTYKIHYQQ